MTTMSMLDIDEAGDEIVRLRNQLGLTEVQLARRLMANPQLTTILGKAPTARLIFEAEHKQSLPSVANTLIIFMKQLLT